MRKLIILQDHLRNGGTERQSIHLARTLAESGCDVTLLTFRPGGALAPQSGISTRCRRPSANFKYRSLQPIDTHLDFFAPRLHATIRRLAPQIVLCMGRMANCKAGRLARAFPRIAVITTMRTGKTLPAAYARSLHATRHTIANSHEAACILRETHALPAAKITVIHNALVMDMAQAAATRAAVTQAASSCDDAKTPPGSNSANVPPVRLLCSAMFRPEKNHRELLELFSRLPAAPIAPATSIAPTASIAATAPAAPTTPIAPTAPAVELHLLGDGSELSACRALAARLGIAGRVRFHGFIADPAPFYQHAGNTIAVLASRSESLPNFLVEAHAHGIPSVAYATGGVAECGGIAIAPGDQSAFLAALTRLITAPGAAAARAAESARVAAHAREHFSPQTQLRRYLALFDKLAPAP